MSKHHHPRASPNWPLWKIWLVTIVAAAVGFGLLWLSLHLPEAPVKAATTAPAPATPANVPGFTGMHVLLLFALLSWALAAVFAGWLISKYYMHIPAWRRRQWFGRSK